MKKATLCFVLTTLILSGCNQPHATEQPSTTIIDNHMILTVDSKTVSIPIEKVDSIKKYLDQYSEKERTDEIKRMQTTAFTSNSRTVYGDIQYNCGVKLCNHALVQIKNDEVRSLPLHPGSIFVDHVFSPDEKYLAVLLGKNEGTEIIRHSLMLINTESFSIANFKNDHDLVNLLTSPDITIPILAISWENETTSKVTIPDTTNYEYETLVKWRQSENKTKEVILTAE